MQTHARVQRVLPEGVGPILTSFFSGGGGGGGMRGERIQIALKAGHHQPASETPWPTLECWLGSFVIFQGIRTSIC